jgi:hypothetical protein
MFRRARRITMEVAWELVDFVQHNIGRLAAVIPNGESASVECDRYLWSMSLPYIAGCLPPFVPCTAPAPWPRSEARAALRVGICWATGIGGDHQPNRSIPLVELTRLFQIDGVEWYNLQVGSEAAAGDRYANLLRTQAPFRTFAHTANVVAGLDYVISADTATCHLAGSLGVPTFLVLRYASDFKWGLGDTTGWYPSMRIIRQPAPGDWSGAIDLLTGALRSAVHESRPAGIDR